MIKRCPVCGQYDVYVKDREVLDEKVEHILWRCPRCHIEWDEDKIKGV